jgi:hypothetical protein
MLETLNSQEDTSALFKKQNPLTYYKLSISETVLPTQKKNEIYDNKQYMDTFYDISKLSSPQKIELLNNCKAVCCNWWIDKLDCSQSFNR